MRTASERKTEAIDQGRSMRPASYDGCRQKRHNNRPKEGSREAELLERMGIVVPRDR